MKTAIITGTSSGLGEGFARALLDLGWKVYGISRREASPELRSNENFRQVAMDLTKPLDRKLLHETVQEKKIDLIVNNAGLCILDDADKWKRTHYEQMFSVQYTAPMELISIFSDRISEGQIINILSDSAIIGWERFGIFSASKAALKLNTESLARERKDMTIYNLLPCAIDTPIFDSFDSEMMNDRLNFMKINDVVTVFLQLVSGILSLPSGSSVVLHNDWEAEDIEQIHAKEYVYNIDTEKLTKL